jgi:NAD(P)-dependent dehydrogenase (short-subunit alcohol dehydrogenase family)
MVICQLKQGGFAVKIAVIDGQGGGIGKSIVEKLKKELPKDAEILALGTNALATAAMLKAGADEGATGENAVVVNAPKMDLIVGVIGIISANAMLGELTPAIARAVSESPAQKILIPLNRCGIEVVGTPKNMQLPQLVDALVGAVCERCRSQQQSL